jgi:hypothetical protein
MAKLTREQANTWNKGNANGFSFDPYYYLTHGEKTSKKTIDLGNNHLLVVCLMYRDEYETKSNEYGCKWSVTTGKQIPTAHFADYLDEGAVMVSHGLGYWHTLGAAVDKKNYSALKELSGQLDDETCLAIYATLKDTKVNQYA